MSVPGIEQSFKSTTFALAALVILTVAFSSVREVSAGAALPTVNTILPRAARVAGKQTEITQKNWFTHPKIQEIQKIVRSVNAGLKKNAYKISRREFEVCPYSYFTVRRIGRDRNGAVAWYEHFFSYEDGSYDYHYYFDPQGRLRFVLAYANAANGTHEEKRSYFDQTGKQIWEFTKRKEGMGCPGCFEANSLSDAGRTFNPERAFVNDEGCKEMKREPKRSPVERRKGL